MSVDEVFFLHFKKQKIRVKTFLFGSGLIEAFKAGLKNAFAKMLVIEYFVDKDLFRA